MCLGEREMCKSGEALGGVVGDDRRERKVRIRDRRLHGETGVVVRRPGQT